MVVAFGAADGGTEPCHADGADAVGGVFGEIFLGLSAALAGHHGEPVEAGGGPFAVAWFREEIAGELGAGELVEGEILIEGIDDPVAVGPCVVVLVAVEADGIGVADDIEPVLGHAFAVLGAGEELVGEGFEGGWSGDGGGETGEVEGEPACEDVRGGFRGGCDILGEEWCLDEGVDGIADGCAGVVDGGDRWTGDGGVGPVGFVGSAFGDPLGEEGFLGRGEGFVGIRGRHEFVRIGVGEPGDEFAGGGVAWDDGGFAGFGGFEGGVADVEAETAFAVIGVGAVAVEAVVGKDGPDVAVVAERGCGGVERQQQQSREGEPEHLMNLGGGSGRARRGDGPLVRWNERRGDCVWGGDEAS